MIDLEVDLTVNLHEWNDDTKYVLSRLNIVENWVQSMEKIHVDNST